jgi:hypothetical protein
MLNGRLAKLGGGLMKIQLELAWLIGVGFEAGFPLSF